MKKILLLILLPFLTIISSSQQKTMLITGASFASENNGWFELGCQSLGVRPINRAVGGEAIANTANRMIEGTLYTQEEFENIDVFVIMQAHNMDVYEDSQLKENYLDYKTPFDRSNYAAAYDYVIKRYIAECYKLKDKKDSKYYNSKHGKPAIIVLCTHWHDGRTTYNSSVRKLAEKWGFSLVEFDTNIGFSKNQVHPLTGKQYNMLYANDTETIDNVVYGWHPQDGKDKYIQQRMAAIFSEKIRSILFLH